LRTVIFFARIRSPSRPESHFLVDLAHQHHFHDIHGFGVSHPHALDVVRLDLHAREHLVDLGAAAMNDHRVYTDVLHQDDVKGEVFLQLLVHHGVAAVFDHHRLVVKAPDVG
jgi:hypothetical protein